MMVLDTNALLWLRIGSSLLGSQARNEIEIALRAGELAESAISCWKVAFLQSNTPAVAPTSLKMWRFVATAQPGNRPVTADQRILY